MFSRRSLLRVSGPVLILSCLCLSVPLLGQEGLSTLRGTVTDPSGGVVPGVEVVVEEMATGMTVRKIATDGQGNYEVPALKEGTYRLKAAKSGFKTFVATDIFLASDQVKRVDVELQVGTTTTESVANNTVLLPCQPTPIPLRSRSLPPCRKS